VEFQKQQKKISQKTQQPIKNYQIIEFINTLNLEFRTKQFIFAQNFKAIVGDISPLFYYIFLKTQQDK